MQAEATEEGCSLLWLNIYPLRWHKTSIGHFRTKIKSGRKKRLYLGSYLCMNVQPSTHLLRACQVLNTEGAMVDALNVSVFSLGICSLIGE